MPRGNSFGELVTMFREQAGMAVSPRLGQNQLPGIRADLKRTYRRLHSDFNWPHLMVKRDKTLSPGQQFYAFPDDLDFSRVVDAWVKPHDGRWMPLNYGIDLLHYNRVASDQGARSDPPRCWELYEGDQWEVWPIPQDDGHVVRFSGIRKPKSLVNDSDIVDLDDDLVVLYAVGERLARDRSADAEMKLQQARQLYLRLRANSQKDAAIDMRVNSDRGSRGSLPIDISYVEGRE